MTAAPAPARRRPMQAADQRRLAHWRYVSHAQRCRYGADLERCQTCRDLIRDADAESWRRQMERGVAPRLLGGGS